MGIILYDSHWKPWTFSLLKLWNKFTENENFLEYRFSVKSTTMENATSPHKTASSKSIVKTNKTGSTKWSKNKERGFATNYFIFLKIYFWYKNLLKITDLMYQSPKYPNSYFSYKLEFYFTVVFPVSILKN